MARVGKEIVFFASAEQLEGAGTVDGTARDCAVFEEICAVLSVTAAAGTNPTLNVHFEVSNDGAIWSDLGVAFTEIAVTGTEYKAITVPFGKWVRAAALVGSGAADGVFTFSVAGLGKLSL